MLGCLVIDLVDQERCFKYTVNYAILLEQPLLVVLLDKYVEFVEIFTEKKYKKTIGIRLDNVRVLLSSRTFLTLL